jgi:hypothetical protein
MAKAIRRDGRESGTGQDTPLGVGPCPALHAATPCRTWCDIVPRTRALHDRALLRIREAMASVTGDDKARRRLAVQVGTPRALEDLATLTGILANRDLLSESCPVVAHRLFMESKAAATRFFWPHAAGACRGLLALGVLNQHREAT